MKIAFFVGEFPQLSESFIRDQVQACIDRGHDVTVFTTSHRACRDMTGDASAAALAGLVAVPSRGASPSRVKAATKLLALAKSYGSVNIRQCVSFITHHAPQHFDVIHAHFAPSGRRAALLKKTGYLTGRLITTFHGYDLNSLPRNYPLSYYRPIFEEADRLTCGSNFMLDLAQWMGAPTEKLVKIPMGVDLERFAFTERPAWDGLEPLRLVSVGRLTEVKGHSLAIRAIAALSPKLSIHYTIVGDGPLRGILEHEVNTLGLSAYVQFTGPCTREEIRDILSHNHGLLHPAIQTSNGAVESQGVILAEAAAAGLPIIATRSGGIPDTVRAPHNGYLVSPNNVNALTEAILSFSSERHRWPEMGRASRAIAEEYFNADRLQQQFFDLYECE